MGSGYARRLACTLAHVVAGPSRPRRRDPPWREQVELELLQLLQTRGGQLSPHPHRHSCQRRTSGCSRWQPGPRPSSPAWGSRRLPRGPEALSRDFIWQPSSLLPPGLPCHHPGRGEGKPQSEPVDWQSTPAARQGPEGSVAIHSCALLCLVRDSAGSRMSTYMQYMQNISKKMQEICRKICRKFAVIYVKYDQI